jgi:hypothetical protein
MRIVRVEEMICGAGDIGGCIAQGLIKNVKLDCKLENKATRLDSRSGHNAKGGVPPGHVIFDGYIEIEFFLGAQWINIR